MISRSQIYVVNLSPTHGREQAGRRPVPVVSADAINRQPLVVTAVVGTDAKNVPRAYPTNVRVTAKETGLPIDTVFLCFQCFQIHSLDPARFFDPKTHRPNLAGTMPAEGDNPFGLSGNLIRRLRVVADGRGSEATTTWALEPWTRDPPVRVG